jgi:hypothetical protein
MLSVILMALFIGWASVSQGHHFDMFMDNVDMVYMDIMICWNIMCIYFGPTIDVFRRPIISKPWPVQFLQFAKQNNR